MKAIAQHINNNFYNWYSLYDTFGVAVTAGSVNGSPATGVGGARMVVDTNSKISVANGLLSFATGAVAADGVRWARQDRVIGKTIIGDFVPANTNGNIAFGFNSFLTGTPIDGVRFGSGGVLQIFDNGNFVAYGSYTAVPYQLAVIHKGLGSKMFIKGGAFTYWTIIGDTVLSAYSSAYPAVQAVNATSVFTACNIRIRNGLYYPGSGGGADQYDDLEFGHALTANISILGDSLSDTPGLDWPYKMQGCNPVNHSVGGVTIINGMDAQVIATANDNSSRIIIALGTNDDNAGNMVTLQAEVEENIIELKASNPSATLYWMNVLPRWTNAGGATPVDKANIRAAIAAACAAQSITCWDTFTTPWITAAQTSDGLHPLAGGSLAIATQILARL